MVSPRNVLFQTCICCLGLLNVSAAGIAPPVITNLNVNGSEKNLRFAPYPGAQSYEFYRATNVSGPFLPDPGFSLSPYAEVRTNGTNYGYEWRSLNTLASSYYKVGTVPMSADDVLTANVLNRLAFGPSPDELTRVKSMGPQAYIDEQLAMQGVTDTLDHYIVEATNSVPIDPATNWTQIIVTGKFSGTNLYLFLTSPGEVYIDDIELYAGTNGPTGLNLLYNGDFESSLPPSWTLNGTAGASGPVAGVAHSGAASLKLSSSAAGSTSANYVRQSLSTSLTNNEPVTLSYWYLPSPGSSKLRVQLNGSGLISSAGGVPPKPGWVYAEATGKASSTGQLYFYLSGAGQCYIDDVTLVSGTVAGQGPNLIQNPGLEAGVLSPWILTPRYTSSALSTSVAHSGSASMQIVGSAAGSSSSTNAVVQSVSLVNGQTYTLSYWYLPVDPGVYLNARLAGNLLISTPDRESISGLYRRLETQQAGLEELRAWACRRAVESPRQLLEVLSHFWENHFVTEHTKTRNYLGGFSYPDSVRIRMAADWEAREFLKWRQAMMNPDCTFYDLLKISAESPAMIVYLDTVSSRGDGTRIANENYARELLELFTFGVDNGYDQEDIIRMSRAWTGWSVDIVDPPDINNPLAPLSVTYLPNANSTAKSNTVGVWTFVYRSANHGTNRGALFQGRTVPARFGPPWAGRSYQLNIPARSGTNGLQDGYDVIAHLANQPFTQEYISIKLCRLFVHDRFPNPTSDPSRPEYSFYDYTNPNRSEEVDLVHQCMLAWENSNPKGQLRPVLQAIFNSRLFREQSGTLQKVRTPLEFVAASIRALRTQAADGTYTAVTDGYAFTSPLSRMGGMELFDREAPDGYPEDGPPWISAGTLTERIRFTQAYLTPLTSTRTDAGNNSCNPVALLKKLLPSTEWNNANAVAGLFLSLLYPGEGKANLALYQQAAVRFMDTSDDGLTSSPFAGLSNTGTPYDTRVRATVAMLMTMQRFQEQ